jgi:hypothetical protein
MNDISVVPTSQVSTAVTLIMLDTDLNIMITQLTNAGQLVHDTEVYNKIRERTNGESGQIKSINGVP